MLLGDAAGLVDPITREGIFFALRSGSLAAAALAGGDPSATYEPRDPRRRSIPRSSARDRLRASFFQPRFIAAPDWRAHPEPGDSTGHGRSDWRTSTVRRLAASIDRHGGTGSDAESCCFGRSSQLTGRGPARTYLARYPSRARTVTSGRFTRTVIARHCASPADDRRRRHVTKQVLLSELRGDDLHRVGQLRGILRLERTAAGERGQLREQRRTRLAQARSDTPSRPSVRARSRASAALAWL